MGRKPKNAFVEGGLSFADNFKVKRYDIKMPFLYNLTVESNDPTIAKFQTTGEYHAKDQLDLDRLIREVESQERFKLKVIKVDPAVRPLIDLCPKCHMKGIPKIEKKDTHDNRERSWRYQQSITRKERLPEYWLTYTHSKSKKCRICQYINTPEPAYKRNKINIAKYFFPQVLESLKNGSFWYADQSQQGHSTTSLELCTKATNF